MIVTPNGLDGVKTQPVAVPVFEKSAAAKPDIRSLNVKRYDIVRDEEGEEGGVNATVAPAVSATVVVGAIPEIPGVSGATVDIAKRIQRPRTCEIAYGGCDVASRESYVNALENPRWIAPVDVDTRASAPSSLATIAPYTTSADCTQVAPVQLEIFVA